MDTVRLRWDLHPLEARRTLVILLFWLLLDDGGGCYGNLNLASPSASRVGKEKDWFSDFELEDLRETRFYLYRNTMNEDERSEILVNHYPSLVHSNYNAYIPLILLIHGPLSDSGTFPDVKAIKDEYLMGLYPYNIVMVDYGSLTRSLHLKAWLSFLKFKKGKKGADRVAENIVDFIYFLINGGYLSGPENVHIVAFSKGTSIAAEVGRLIREETGRMVRRISGLDPLPSFINSEPMMLSPDSAHFVDVTFTSWLGSRATKHGIIGHVQFFMNGGWKQPNCPNLAFFTQPYCSHFNAVNYFAKSIRRKVPILGCRCIHEKCKDPPEYCANPTIYGHHVPPHAMGDFYVDIN